MLIIRQALELALAKQRLIYKLCLLQDNLGKINLKQTTPRHSDLMAPLHWLLLWQIKVNEHYEFIANWN